MYKGIEPKCTPHRGREPERGAIAAVPMFAREQSKKMFPISIFGQAETEGEDFI
jgi:hypothetical protein